MNKKNRKGIVFIPFSVNYDSMMNIINIVFCDEICTEYKLPLVNKITFLCTQELIDATNTAKGKKMEQFLAEVRETLGGDCVEIRNNNVVKYAKDIPIVITDAVKEVGKDNIIIDLTCGKKDVTGSLYTAASISQIKNMIYVDVFRRSEGNFPKLDRSDYENIKNMFKITRYESLGEIETLASLNEMDFIIYKKSVQEICQKTSGPQIESYAAQLGHVIEEYFSEKKENYSNAIRVLGLISEDLTKSVGKQLSCDYHDLLENKYNPNRSLDTIRDLEGKFHNKETKAEDKERLNEAFSYIPGMFEMMEMFRLYRNRASHDQSFSFGKEDVKLLLDMMLLLINGIIKSGIAKSIWENKDDEQ